MHTTTRFLPALLGALLFFSSPLFAQNLSISATDPDGLFVCGSAEMSVTIQNAGGSPAATTLRLSAVFPPGVEYETGTLSGATEFNISNPNQPVFSLADLAGGAGPVSITFRIKAGCALVNQINSGAQFDNEFTATYIGGSKTYTSDTYNIETGLIFISSVSPVAVNSAVKGDVITRTIKLRNTRQGPIRSLSFRDQHDVDIESKGISIELTGGTNQVNTDALFTADIPGSYFTAFGDGDDLLEESDGEITLTEKVTVTSCGIPSLTIFSDIIISWGCDALACDSDTAEAGVTIKPTTQNSKIEIETIFAKPLSNCGAVPSVQEILIVNTGSLLADDVKVDLYSPDSTYLGLDANSFQWLDENGVWQQAQITTAQPTTLTSCDMHQYMKYVTAVVPLVPANSTVRLRFNTYSCQPLCDTLRPQLKATYRYENGCISDQVIGSAFFQRDTTQEIRSELNFIIGHCLKEDVSNKLIYWVKSKRLLDQTGVLQIVFELPLGLSWDDNCSLNLDGKTPLSFNASTSPEGLTTVKSVFSLPFSKDSIADEICIKYNCNTNMACEPPVDNIPPRGFDYFIYPVESDCEGCELPIRSYSTISLSPNDTKECGITYCDDFSMIVDNHCNPNSGVEGSLLLGSADLLASIALDSWRVNRGLQDNDDNRIADNNNPAAAPGLRLDRFIPGDTMRNELKIAVHTGQLYGVLYRLFLESVRSEMLENEGDAFEALLGKVPFVNFDSIVFAGGRVIIKKPNGTVTTCQVLAPSIRSDQHRIRVATPNIRPEDIVDELISMFDQYRFSLPGSIANGCLPAGFTIGAGDSVFLQTDYRFTNNFTPFGNAFPPLINFKTTVCDTTKTFAWQQEDICLRTPLRQFSGYVEVAKAPAQRINPCDVSTELSPFSYTMRIARENMFPFEVRPLSSIKKFSYQLPPDIDLLETKLNYLKLQENVPRFSNVAINTVSSNNAVELDLSPFFNTLLDEGYSFEISTQYDTSCGYNFSKVGITNLDVLYANEGFHDPVQDQIILENLNGYQDGSPQLEYFNINGNVLYAPTSVISRDFKIHNISPVQAPNAWIIVDSDYNLENVQLYRIDGVTQVPIPLVGGVYQLDSIKPNDELTFRIKATNKSCSAFTVNFRFGWSCSPTLNAQANSCGELMGSFEVRPETPELELIIKKEPSSIPLCDPSDDFEFEIANADEGSAYSILPSVKLPSGISIVPGSSRLSFPASTMPLINIPDPLVLTGNVWQFNLASVAALVQNGLVSVQQEPLNALQIYFKVRAECGAISGAKPVYGAEALKPCGISSNVLRKSGKHIQINGVNAVNSADPDLRFANPVGSITCGDEITLSASILLEGTPAAGDSIYIDLPAGTSYVEGSYAAGINAPLGPPDGTGLHLRLPLPLDLGGSSSTILEFTFKIRYDTPADCIDKIVTLQTREKTQGKCGAVFCDVYAVTGEDQLNLNVQNPELQVNNFQLHMQSGGQSGFSANLENVGNSISKNPVVKIYQDLNGNGIVDPGDLLVVTQNLSGTSITPGATVIISGNLSLPPSDYCDLIALIPAAENCACADRMFPLGGNQVVTTGIGLCSLQPVDVGTTFVSGNTYSWQSIPGLVCKDANCNSATYTPGPDVALGSLVTLIQTEKAGDCVIERRYDIQFGGNFGIETTSQTICQGNTAILKATGGGISYKWTGPGISNYTQQNLSVTPTASGIYTYTVEVTFAGGCPSGTGTATVTVEPSVSSSSEIISCVGAAPVEIFKNVFTDVAGVYSRTYTAMNGCDSVSTVTLIVPDIQTNEVITICPGDSTEAYGEFFYDFATKCSGILESASGCDSMHCKIVNVAINPNVGVQDSIVLQAGTEITLQGPAGSGSYHWSFPGSATNCNKCDEKDYTVTPEETTKYTLAYTYGPDCPDTITYRVFICNAEEYLKKVPNAFTPNSDQLNDVFRPLPNEGLEMVVSLEIFNRWGEKVYSGRGKNAQWDGNFRGKPAASDVYVFNLVVICDGFEMNKNGELTLIR